jgi:predicted metal-binding membrane protein/uncharacterized protein (DUF302 family)
VSTIDSGPPALDWRARLGSDRAFLAASALLFIASATGTIYTCKSKSGMPMPGGWTMSMVGTRMAGQTRLAAASSFIWMWVVMMLVMMLPSLVPMLLRFRGSLRGRGETDVGMLTWITAAGYFLTWAIFGVVVYPLEVSLSFAETQWPIFLRFLPLATGVVLLLAGGIQLTPWKTRRLGRCRDAPICRSVSRPAVTAWRYGIRLGSDCSLCCIGFMTVMLVYDAMSLPAMFFVTAAITVERLAQNPERVARVIGALIIAVGLLVIARAVSQRNISGECQLFRRVVLVSGCIVRDSLAAERTFLAWIRTGLSGWDSDSLRRDSGCSAANPVYPTHSLSPVLRVVAVVRHSANRSGIGRVSPLRLASPSTVREMNRGGSLPPRPSTQAVAIALFLALVALAMAIYLISIRSAANLHSKNDEEASMVTAANQGIVDRPSNHSVDQTVDRVKNILQSKGVTLFILVDHSGEAEKVGLKMPPTKLLIFGNPKAGTPLMLAAPRSAIDLPLKILIWEDAQGKVWVTYNSPAYLQERHRLPEELLQNVAVVETLATKAAE